MVPFANTASNSIPFTAWPWMVGFDRQLDTIGRIHESIGRGSSYPPYNIIRTDEDTYSVELAVAGFTKDEIRVRVQDSVLTVEGSKAESLDLEYLHKGIGTRSFTQTFVLAEYVEIAKATLIDGVLTVHLIRVLPEAKKAKTIEIL
mgnify:CR=1 FL=1